MIEYGDQVKFVTTSRPKLKHLVGQVGKVESIPTDGIYSSMMVRFYKDHEDRAGQAVRICVDELERIT